MLSIIFLVFLTGCSSLNSQDRYPSIEKECEMSGNKNSPQCKIITMDEWSQDEKQHHMGFIYFSGKMQDCSKAKYWFEKAAKNENAKSLEGLSILYYTGCGVDKDYKKAEEYSLLASEKGDRQAKVNLGELYREGGYGLLQDYDKALYWYQLGIKDTPARAYNGIAAVYLDQKNYEEAYKYIVKAADLGHPQSEYNLGYYYYTGTVVKQDEEKAKSWFEKAAVQGNTDAQYYLEEMKKGAN